MKIEKIFIMSIILTLLVVPIDIFRFHLINLFLELILVFHLLALYNLTMNTL